MQKMPDSDVLRELFMRLKDLDYLETARIPSLKRPSWMFLIEPHVLFKYMMGNTNPFTPTAVPGLYGRLWFRSHGDTREAYNLFFLNRPGDLRTLEDLLGTELVRKCLQQKILEESEDIIESNYRLVPWRDSIFLSDPDQGDRRTTVRYVYVGSDSVLLAEFVRKHLMNSCYEKGLDLCAGTAIQGHNIRSSCRQVMAAEYNPRAVEFARASVYANGIDTPFQVIQSDLWENVEGSFDLIVSNPPYYPVDESRRNAKILDVFGGSRHGMEKPLIIFDGLGQYLRRDGRGVLLAASPVIEGEDLLKEELRPYAEKHGLDTVLVPWKYTNIKLEPDYQVKHGIDYLVHYIVFAHRTGSGRIHTAKYPPLVKMLEKFQIALQKRLPSWPEP